MSADIFTVWIATGPELREVLTLQGEAVACPSLVRAIRQRQHDRHQPAEIRTLFGIAQEPTGSNAHV